MRILGVSGSPRRDGNSDTAAKKALQMLEDLGETKFVRIADYRIEHCAGCRECMRLLRCAIEDDEFEQVFNEWLNSDLIIISDPVYWNSPPGVMKDFIDRSHAVYAHTTPPFKGKKVALISVATEGGFDTHDRILSSWLRHYGAELIGKVRLYAREKDDLLNRPSQMRKLEEFISELKGKIFH
jgi:multimeric flavodoxin WrbA